MITHVTVLHPDSSSTFYSVGPGAEFETWKITPNGLVFYRDDGSRMHILPGSILNFSIYPCKGSDDDVQTLRPEEAS